MVRDFGLTLKVGLIKKVGKTINKMAKIYNEEINKHTDWGGDESTGNLPVSGYRI